jgi:hypothetical protein
LARAIAEPIREPGERGTVNYELVFLESTFVRECKR